MDGNNTKFRKRHDDDEVCALNQREWYQWYPKKNYKRIKPMLRIDRILRAMLGIAENLERYFESSTHGVKDTFARYHYREVSFRKGKKGL